MRNPVLSIVIPVYNGEKYISNIIEAFQKQACSGYELIFIDDGSSDCSFDLIRDYQAKTDIDITVYKQKNSGVSAARNKGISLAKGDFISFVDVDDYISDDYMTIFEKNITSEFDVMVFQSRRLKETDPFVSATEYTGTLSIDKLEMLERMVINPTRFGVYNLFIKKSFLETHDLKFQEGYRYYEDYDFLYRLFSVSQDILITEHQMYYYILREKSAMAKFVPDRISCLTLMKRLIPHFNNYVPEFAKHFEMWGISRLYWSIAWQACLAFGLKDALQFFSWFNIRGQMLKLTKIPDKKVRYTAILFLINPCIFVLLAKIFGGFKSKVERASLMTFEHLSSHKKDKVLVYGMTDNPGGIESYVMNVYRNIDKTKWQFDFIVDWNEMSYEQEVLDFGSEIYYIPAKSKAPIGHLAKFAKVLFLHPEYKIVYFNILNAGAAYSMVLPKLLGRKIVVHSHNNMDDNMRLHKIFKPILNRLVDKKIACSDLAAKYMYTNTTDVSVIKNGINTEEFSFDAKKRDEIRNNAGLQNKKVILHVGRIAPQKNPYFLIDIMRELKEISDDYVLVYIGAGPLEQPVKEYVQKLELTDCVMFLGARNDVCDWMNAADLFLLPSKYEGFGIVLLEAQVNGLPCFTSKDVVPKETDVNGLVKFIDLQKSPKEWAAEIDRCILTDNRIKYANSLEKTGFTAGDAADEIDKILSEFYRT